jgi:hypothetical protein
VTSRAALASHWRWAVAAATICLALGYLAYIILAGKFGWDFAVYRAGIAAFKTTGNPYDAADLAKAYGVDLPFTYPPVVVLLFAQLTGLFSNPFALALLFAAHVAAVVAIPALLSSYPFPIRGGIRALIPRDFLWMLGAYLVLFGFSGAKLLASCNIAAVLVCLCLVAMLYSVRRRDYMALWIALVLVCQIKIYLICFAAVPFLLDRKIWQPALLAVLVMAGYTLNWILAPGLVHGWLDTMGAFANGPGFVGISVMEAVHVTLQTLHFAPRLIGPLALGIHAVYSAGVIGFSALALWTRARPADARLVLPWALMAAMLISPRLIENDLAIAVIPFLVLLMRLVSARGIGLGVAVAGFVLGTSLIKTPLGDWGALFALLGVWLGSGIDWFCAAAPASMKTAASAHAARPAGPLAEQVS